MSEDPGPLQPPITDPEILPEQLSGYDHRPLFQAYEANQTELTAKIGNLLTSSTPQPVRFEDPESRLLITTDEAARIWGLFPEPARKRASPYVPIVRALPPMWFARGSSVAGPVTTVNPSEAISPTANAMGRVGMEESEETVWYAIDLCELPDNGFSREVRRLAQIKVLVHELAHTFVAPEWHHGKESWILRLPNGTLYDPYELIEIFGKFMEESPPISYYSSAYRDGKGKFAEDEGRRWLGIEEELVEQVAAYVLGFVVNPNDSPNPGLNVNPFAEGEHDKDDIEVYLNSERVLPNQDTSTA